jgi:ribosome biogenesis GTPase
VKGRVLESAGGVYRVRAGDRELDCSLRGRIKLGPGSIAIGDLVEVELLEDGSCRIESVLPRTGRLARRSFAKRREQVLAANVDQVAAVVSVSRPEPDFFLLDRLLAVAELNDLSALVVCNKADLLGPGEGPLPSRLRDYAAAGYAVLPVSAKTGSGLDDLTARLADRITVLAGPSGAGKSSLVNAMVPGTDLRVGEVGDRSGRGRHTTTSGRLIPLGGDTYLADTPGVQNFEPAALDPAELSMAFREFRPHLGACRFSDCRHRNEPGCAVLGAVETGEISRHRYESYLSLLEAAEQAARPWERGGG